jgi:hypothetical protein
MPISEFVGRKIRFRTEPGRPHGAGCRVACARFDRIGRIGVFLEILGEKRLENRQKLQIRRHNDRFPPKSSCRLSYQACRITRILRPVGHAGLRGLAIRFYF